MIHEGNIMEQIHRLNHKIMMLGFQCFQKMSLHPRQIPLLILISKNEGIGQAQLSEKLKNKPSTLNVSISRLERGGYVRKEKNPKDQRCSKIYLTPQGKEAVDELAKTMDDLQQSIASQLSPEDTQAVNHALDQLEGIIDQEIIERKTDVQDI